MPKVDAADILWCCVLNIACKNYANFPQSFYWSNFLSCLLGDFCNLVMIPFVENIDLKMSISFTLVSYTI